MPTLNDIPPEIRALINELDLACLTTEDDGWLDDGLLWYLSEEQPEPETPAWVETAIAANPGVWLARLCRAMHGRPETYRSIAHCAHVRTIATSDVGGVRPGCVPPGFCPASNASAARINCARPVANAA